MLARSVLRSASRVAAVARPALVSAPQVRFMGHGHDHHHDDTPKFTLNKDGVAIPELVDSLEWLLDAPPNVHQFDEPPIVVEIEHLENLKVHDE
eukprot:CAMPEP_0116973686 /NCGR_PEP_ID=MMETSP0467-20121206/54660_1 /TAXON_ID=283647 /ORGANISM="Mesodinium pulex, Strain SPMC105" /LENGTH=93 /DNA_ID=CAMNT_0004665565 /DNA_START=17 /DNA_END=298 /DNA_ORIENTATION=+